MIARVAVVPQPPLLVPELVAGEDPDAQRVRAECLAVGARLAEAARRWVAVAVDSRASADLDAPTVVGPRAAGTFRGYGVDVRVRLAAGADLPPDPALPLPALIAGWLRAEAGADEVRVWMVPPGLAAPDCRAFGERLGAELAGDEPVGLLVIGDGSHRHGERAVGRPDERAAGFDEQVRRALAAADPDALLGLDAGLAAALGVVGRAAWHILSGVVAKDGRPWECVHSRLLIPFGVAYHFAVWDPR
ncbi:hypothetical protein [Actinophytocola sp.]|uniref:hypothetical protein n=1 Tax=Actinophytocola sp. TaxID=1872138 RepID=UPI002D7F5F2B|nr:hypothetical protein [Actinophytocola sp.]HET9140127.1 hypothetical protein [Actinophytocola sp.]